MKAVEKNDVSRHCLCDEHFHAYIVECSKNKLLISINKQISDYLKNFREKTFYIPSNSKNLIVPHLNILQAFIEKDEAKAERCMLEHLDWVRKDLEKSKNFDLE
jgi:GntR family transcriptional repressor for pyruvate dehydrogenase complex